MRPSRPSIIAVALVAGVVVVVVALLARRGGPAASAQQAAASDVDEQPREPAAVELGLGGRESAREQAAEPAEGPPVVRFGSPLEKEAPASEPRDDGTILVALLAPNGEALLEAAGESQLPEPRVWTTREPYDATLPAGEWRPVERCGRFMRKNGRSPADRELGTIALSCERPVWVSLLDRYEVVASKLVGPGEEEAVFVLDPEEWRRRFASLRFRVVDAGTGEPLAAAIPFTELSSGGTAIHPKRSDGRHVLEGLPPGPLGLVLIASGYADERRDVVLTGGEELDIGDVPMEPATDARVRVRVHAPTGATDVQVVARNTPSLLDEGSVPAIRWSEPLEGEEWIETTLPAGRWAFWAEALVEGEAWRSPLQDVELGEGLAEIALELSPRQSVELRSLSRSQVVEVRDAAGLLVTKSVARPDRATTLQLVAGRYELTPLFADEGERWTVSFTVGSGPASVQVP